jgi:proteasome lid subunit RPN8/RPN11
MAVVRLASLAQSHHIGCMALHISQSALAAMIAAARDAAPCEACGVLLGAESRIDRVVPAANVAPDPARHFEIDPAALIAAHRAARDGLGPDVIGYYHSHPNGLARPSATDAQSAARDGRVWVIVANGGITCWCDGQDGFEPLSYAVTQG